MKNSIIEQTSILLLKHGYTVKSFTRACFDILARSEDNILLIKVIEDANTLSKSSIEEMHYISSYISASPLIITEKAGIKLNNNIIYSRYNIQTLNYDTFRNCIENKFPFIMSNQAGLTATIRSKTLKEKREQLGYSLATLSKRVGVSRKMIQRYEEKDSQITMTKAFRLYDIFGTSIFQKINIFKHNNDVVEQHSTDISKKFGELGFKTLETKKVPFDLIAKKDKEIILTEVGDKDTAKLHTISRLIDSDNLVIFEKKRPKDIPSMTKEEFLSFEKAKQLIKFVKEF